MCRIYRKWIYHIYIGFSRMFGFAQRSVFIELILRVLTLLKRKSMFKEKNISFLTRGQDGKL